MTSRMDLDSVDYTCPKCGASTEGPVSFSSEVETIEVFPLIPAWPDGPLISDVGQMPKHKPVDQWFSTSVCADRFSMTLWDISLTTRTDRTGALVIQPKQS